MENIKTKTEKIYKACEKYFKEEEINEDYIDKAKKLPFLPNFCHFFLSPSTLHLTNGIRLSTS